MATFEELLSERPRNRSQLRSFVFKRFGIRLPDRAVCPNHNSPLDYLADSFFHQEDLLVWANRGGGKTMMAAIATVLDAVFRSPSRIVVLGGSFDQSDRLADHIRDLLSEQADLIEGKLTRQRVKLAGGSEIRMLAQSQRAVRGQHVQKIRCDEVDLFDAEVWRAVQFSTRSKDFRSPVGSLRSDGAAGQEPAGESGKGGDGSAGILVQSRRRRPRIVRGSIEVLSTLHRSGGLMHKLVQQCLESEFGPGDRAGDLSRDRSSPKRGRPRKSPPAGYRLIRWCLWEVIERCPRRRRCQDCLLADDCRGLARNGRGYFSIDDAIAIKARSSRAAWEAEMLCRGAQREYLVFEEFDPARHVAKVEYCRDWPLYRAIDFGYRSPLVCLWIQVTPGGRVHVLNEYFRCRVSLPAHAAEIKKRDLGPAAATYVDPAGRHKESTSGAACTEILISVGIPCICRASTIAEGLELVRAALAPAAGAPTLAIHPRCLRLIEAFNNYHYPPPGKAGDGDADKPVKDGPDHFIDALRYFFINRMRPGVAVGRRKY